MDHSVGIALGRLVLIGFGVVAVRLALQLWASWLEAKISADYLAEQRNRLFGLFVEASWVSKSDTRAADMQTMLTTNVDRAQHLLASLSSGMASLGNVVVLLVSALLLSPLFALVIGVVAAGSSSCCARSPSGRAGRHRQTRTPTFAIRGR